jgi:thiamine transporter ThiT
MLPFRNIARAIGSPDDPIATDTTSAWSWISLLKGIYQAINSGTFAASITGRAEGFVALCQSAAQQVGAYARAAKSSKIAAASSASSASTSATNAATSEANSAGYAILTRDAANFASGTVLFGQRARKDRAAAAASATAAAASAASITAEGLILGVQVYS